MDLKQQLEQYQSLYNNARTLNSARNRLIALFDDGVFTEHNTLASTHNEESDVICALGNVAGQPVCAFSQFGPLGQAHTRKILKLYALAEKIGCPVVGIYDSSGLYLNEGAYGMNDCSELIAASTALSGIVPQISLIAGVCIGMNAMLACCADYIILGECAEFLITPPTAQTPEEIKEGEQVVASGSAHLFVVGESNLMQAAVQLIRLLPANNLGILPQFEFEEQDNVERLFSAAYEKMDSVGKEYLPHVLFDKDSSIELYPTFGVHVYGGLGTIEGSPCGVIATAGERLTPDDCDKIARLIAVWDNFGIPVITLINTPGLDATPSSSFQGDMRALSRLSYVYAQSSVPKISLIVGDAWGTTFTTFAGKASGSDYTLAWPCGVISVLAPVTAVAFQISDRIQGERTREQLEKEYREKEASALLAAQKGIIDDVIAPENTRAELANRLSILAAKRAGKPHKKHGNILL